MIKVKKSNHALIKVLKALDLIRAKENLMYTIKGVYIKHESNKNFFQLIATCQYVAISFEINEYSYLVLRAILKKEYAVNIPRERKNGYFFFSEKTKEKIKKENSLFEKKDFYCQDDLDNKEYPDMDKLFSATYPDQNTLKFSDYPTFSFEKLRKIEKLYKILGDKKLCFCPEKIKNNKSMVANHGKFDEYNYKLLVMPLKYN